MPMSTLAVRIPETMHLYIKHKATHTGTTQQVVVAGIIAQHQKQDEEFIAMFPNLLEEQTEEVTHGA